MATALSDPSRNALQADDRAFHDWYRFVLSFPPHLVRDYLDRFGVGGADCVLDPFCGTGTTLVECKLRGVPAVGLEANPVAALASRVKTAWQVDPAALLASASRIAELARQRLAADGVTDNPFIAVATLPATALRQLPAAAEALLLRDSISPLPLHKALVLLDLLRAEASADLLPALELAFAKTVVAASSNLKFGPEVGLGARRPAAPVVTPWLAQVRQMAADLAAGGALANVTTLVHQADAREPATVLAAGSISAVICSPPYPNEKDYTRATRLESVLLGYCQNKAELQALKRGLLRSNTRGVYVSDDDHELVADHPQVAALCAEIERRRLELGKTSGFERTYARVVQLYFGGLARHLAALRTVLRPGARLAYVVGDQASFLRVLIRTGELLADLAQRAGYELVGIDLFRTRLATATRDQLREEVVLLRWPG
ncbi:MAG: hypothetical protein IT204_21615 [Fimbriimonadaceae bacterium]|nr:hypothetical protein [Fimbriimonadaceae bacterium]